MHWHWIGDGWWGDHAGTKIHLWDSPVQEMQQRLIEAWQKKIAVDVMQRKTFQGMTDSCPYLTCSEPLPNPADAGLMRMSLNGTFFTQDRLVHRREESDGKCLMCGLPDSQFHRHWKCEALEPARQECPLAIRKWVDDSPPVVGNHGWIPTPESLDSFRYTLDNIPDTTFDFQPCQIEGILELFTDGSCLNSKCKLSRLSSWGVAVGTIDNPDFFVPVSSGLVTGRLQTSNRGELTACLSAIRFAVHQNQSFRIWTDSSFVVKRLKEALRKQGGSFDNQINNHDLLCEISIALWEARTIFLGVNKVYSHQEIDQLDEAEQWVCRGNDFVDTVAKNAYTEYPIVLQVWNNLSKEISFLKKQRNGYIRFMSKRGNWP